MATLFSCCIWGETQEEESKEKLQRLKRELTFDLQEVEIELRRQPRNPPEEIDKLEKRRRRLEHEIQKVDLKLRTITLREIEERETLKQHNPQYDQRQNNQGYQQMMREDDNERPISWISTERRQQYKEHRDEIRRRYSLK